MVNDAMNIATTDNIKSREQQPDGSILITYDNGDTAVSNSPNKMAPPDPNKTPDTSTAEPIKWDNSLGVDPARQGPPVPGGVDSPGKGVTRINVEAVKHFANNVRSLIPEVKKAIDELEGLRDFGPGNFGAAHRFRDKVFGGSEDGVTLRSSTLNVLLDTHSILESIVLRCDEIVKTYKTAEQLTELDAEEFTGMVSKVQGSVAGMNLGTGG
ncbi:hypothetical protein [Lentzea jiangxiensis]|uniref:X-X-X-Leu-X-X-Gly heptad repeat-containing protein n=1 Tax=Lentzea jiangxiensis TaxID=641025 RepID=A0A1H0SLZ0_9PSEU|nr:hypothetical protein [Lentzea jiangxiensis]SDP42166.1 hypothetical protein SAMN05421507_108120 [Lentzea jiangxiensis]